MLIAPNNLLNYAPPVRFIGLLSLVIACELALGQTPPAPTLRVATFNVSLNRNSHGQLRKDLIAGDQSADRVAAVIRSVRPDIVLLNEVDYDGQSPSTAELFAQRYLAAAPIDVLGGKPIHYPHIYTAAINTGVPSGQDLNRNGATDDPEDAYGFGRFPGQYGMAVLSRFPIDRARVRTMQKLKWSQMPGAIRPALDDESYYSDSQWNQLRLASKSFWDLPVQTPLGILHVLASHPTPPAFDGPEDRNGARNHDEIRLIADYIDGADYIVDDASHRGGLGEGSHFVVLGDLNSDPHDGGSRSDAIERLLNHRLVNSSATPESAGAEQASQRQGQINRVHKGQAKYDTSDFNDRNVGNLRIDFALPSRTLDIAGSGVFWPTLEMYPPAQRQTLLEILRASDHHMVWVDVAPSAPTSSDDQGSAKRRDTQ